MRHNHSHLLVGYWGGLHGGPGGSGSDDSILQCLAPSIFMTCFDAGGNLVYRLAGSAIRSLLGGDIRGRDYLSFWDDADHPLLRTLICDAVQYRKPLCLSAQARIENQGMRESETVLVPVALNKEQAPMLLGIKVFVEPAEEGARLRGPLKLVSAKFTDADLAGYGASFHRLR